MNTRSTVIVAAICLTASLVTAGVWEATRTEVADVLNTLHQAASDADSDVYFDLFAEDAVFMGTDATERWSVAEFKAFAEPYFSQGRGWTYTMKDRNIFLSDDGSTAWFDELLWNDNYGTCRGTGVLQHTDDGWKLVQYNLTIPIPNDLARDFTDQIKSFEKRAAEPPK
jgi:hypothetical protein